MAPSWMKLEAQGILKQHAEHSEMEFPEPGQFYDYDKVIFTQKITFYIPLAAAAPRLLFLENLVVNGALRYLKCKVVIRTK